MAIDDNTSYELTGAQVKDLASKIKAKTDSSSLATVATTGNYNDLTNQPTIPTVNDATLTIQQNGSTVGTFTANASSNATISLTDTTYSAMTGATSGAAGTSGLVPAPAAGDQNKVLKGDGTWGTYDDPMIDEAACAIKPMSNAFAQEIADAYNDAHANPQDPSSYISSLNVKIEIPFMFINKSGEPISTLSGVKNALKPSNRVVYNGTDDKFVSSHGTATKYAEFGLFDPLYSEVKNYKVRAGNSSDSPAFKQYLPYIIVLDEYGSQDAWGYTDGTESADSLTDAPETKYQIAHDANGNLYMASDVNSAGDWKQISNTSYVPNVTYYLQSGTTAGISGITTYIYTDSNRTTPADPATLVDNFNAGKTILLEYEQTGAAEPYGITFQVNSASSDGNPATQCQYKLLISELNNGNGNYNAVTTQLSATVTAGTTFNGIWGIVRVVVPTVHNGTLTITQNGTTVGTFTANQSTNTTLNLAGGVYADDPTSSANPEAWITKTDVDWSTMPSVNYSTTEQKTGGTWINGKPIYKKTVNTGTMPNNTRKNVAHGISNLDFIISMGGAAYGNNTFVPIPYADVSVSGGLGMFMDRNNIIIFSGSNASYLTTSYVTLYYTKTTD